MSVLSVQSPFPIFTDTDGDPLESGYIWIGVANLDPQVNPLAVFWDAALTMPAVQPIRTLAGYPSQAGSPGRIYTTADHSIRVMNKRGTIVFTAGNVRDRFSADLIAYVGPDGLNYTVQDLSDSSNLLKGAALVGYKQNIAGSISRSVSDFNEDTVSVMCFLTQAQRDDVRNKTALIDVTSAINQALLSARKIHFPAGVYLISDKLEVSNYQKITGDGRLSIIKMNDGDKTAFKLTSKTQVIIRDIAIVSSDIGTTAYVGAIHASDCTYCLFDNIYCEGMSWAGIYLENSSYNLVSNCKFSGWIGTVSDSSDICIYRDSNFNTISNNICYGGGLHGVFIQDPSATTTPTGNVISKNQIGAHTCYGIIVYVQTAYDTKTIVDSNIVRDITGTALLGNSGSGIYIQSAGGTVVSNNSVSNCCLSTSTFETNAVGHISLVLGTYGVGVIVPVVVSGNHVNSSRGPGIYIGPGNESAIVDSNTIYSTGIDVVRGEAIYAVNANNLQICNNKINMLNPNYQSINIVASGLTVSNTSLINNQIKTAHFGIAFNIAGAGTFLDVIFCGNRVYGGVNTAFTFNNVTNMQLSSNSCETSGIALSINTCSKMFFSSNRFRSTFVGGNNLIFDGTGTSSVLSQSNDYEGARIYNGPDSGVIITKYGTAAPSGLTWRVGDRVINSNPVVGQPLGWQCTVSGAPGTWVAEVVL